MSLLDSVINTALKTFSKGDSNQDAISSLLASLFKQVGGLPGLIEKFQKGGLGEIINSWMSNNENLPISSEQLRQVLGSDLVETLAEKAGLDTTLFDSLMAHGLPQIVSALTENGHKAPQDVGNISTDMIKNLMGKLLS